MESVPHRSRAQAHASTSQATFTGNRLLALALQQSRVTSVIGITGTPVDDIFPQCADVGIRVIGTRHQHTAVVMAATANYVTGSLRSVVVVSAGPAVTNALTGVLVARDNAWPVVVIGGRRPVHEEGIGYFQELDAVPIFKPVTKWAATVRRLSDIPDAITRAIGTAISGRPGPVYLDLPEDVLYGNVAEHASVQSVSATETFADTRTVAECVRRIREAERPLFIFGEGLRWSYQEGVLQRLVERNGVPFITTPLGRGLLPDDHALCANEVRRWIQSQADLVVMLGAWFDWRFRFGAELGQQTQVIHADIDSATLGKNVKAATTVRASSGTFADQLAALLSVPDCVESEGRAEWRQRITRAVADKRRARTEADTAEAAGSIRPGRLFAELRNFLPDDAIVVLDGNITLAAGQAGLYARRPCSWLDPGWNGCMGVSIPMAMGAKVAEPARLVVAICGDFGFGLTAMDLETAVRHRIPIVVVILNNDGITGIRRQRSRFPPDYPELFSRFQPGMRYERIMDVFGGHAEYVSEAAMLRPALERASASGVAACINVAVDPDASHPGFW
jgi:thiamine pyrophosphate-dependent acetolactate synthase large subunit-like protein